MLHVLLGVLAVAGAFGFLIIIHELGHWVAARRCGVRCPSFGIGVGPKLGGFRWRGTEFELRPIPFIGYVLMTGEDSSFELEEWRAALHRFLGAAPFPNRPKQLLAWLEANKGQVLNEADEGMRKRFAELEEHLNFHPDTELKGIDDCEGNINNKPTVQRLVILLGGICMNLIAALVLFIGLGLTYGIGVIDQETNTGIDTVSPGSAAARSGLTAGEMVTAVDGEPVASGGAMITAIGRHPGQPMKLTVSRKGVTRQLDITPDVALGKYIFTQADGKVRYLYSMDSVNPPGVQPNQAVESIDGQPVKALADLAPLAGKKFEVRLEGRSEPLVIEGPDLKAVGKIGIVPGSVLVIVFQNRTTNKVVAVAPDSPAARAGLQPGDQLIEVGGSPIFGVGDLDQALAHWEGGEKIPVNVGRGDKLEKLEMSAAGAPGLTLEPVTVPLVLATSVRYVWNLAVGPARLLLDLVTLKKSPKSLSNDISGPLRIMQMLYAVSSDLAKFLFFLALLNGAIAGTNLVPIPALDGARCLVVLFGALRGRDVDPEKENRVHAVGLIVLLGLMAVKSITEFQSILAGSSMIK